MSCGNRPLTAEPWTLNPGTEANKTRGEKLMSDDSIHDLLRAVADADATAEASPEIEVRLRKKFRSQRRRSAWRGIALWAPLAPAAAAIVLLFVFVNRKPAAPVNPMLSNTAAASSLEQVVPPLPASPTTIVQMRQS